MFGLSKHDDDQQDDADNLPMMIPGQDYTPAHNPAPVHQNFSQPAQRPIDDISFSSPYTMHQPKPATKVEINDGDGITTESDMPSYEPTPAPMSTFSPAEPEIPKDEPEMPKTEPMPAPSLGGDDLASIKNQALESLAPIVEHIDQSPEDKFKTIMGMVKSSDNKELVSQAYQVAKDISDEKARAQALLDVVSEIDRLTK